MNLAALLRESFFVPLQHPQRLMTYIGGCLGSFGMAILLVGMGLNYGQREDALLTYIVVTMGGAGFLCFPVCYAGFRCLDGKLWRSTLTLLLGLAALICAYSKQDPLILGCGMAALLATFYCSYHMAMGSFTSAGKDGFEVALANTLMTTSNAVGGILVAYVLMDGRPMLAVISGTISMLAGIVFFLLATPVQDRWPLARFLHDKRTMLATRFRPVFHGLRQGALDAHSWIAAALMLQLDFSVIDTGWLLGLNILLVLLLTPLVGKLCTRSHGDEQRWGLILNIAGWCLLLVAPISWVTVTLSNLLRLSGLKMTSVGLQVEWYRLKSVSALSLLEALLAFSRIAVWLVSLPLLFWDIQIYLASMLGLTILLWVAEIIVQRKTADA